MPDSIPPCRQIAHAVIDELELELIVYDGQGHQRGLVAKRFKTLELGMLAGHQQRLTGPSRLDPPGVQRSEAAITDLLKSKLSNLRLDELMEVVVTSRALGGNKPIDPNRQDLITLASQGIRGVISKVLAATVASNA